MVNKLHVLLSKHAKEVTGVLMSTKWHCLCLHLFTCRLLSSFTWSKHTHTNTMLLFFEPALLLLASCLLFLCISALHLSANSHAHIKTDISPPICLFLSFPLASDVLSCSLCSRAGRYVQQQTRVKRQRCQCTVYTAIYPYHS